MNTSNTASTETVRHFINVSDIHLKTTFPQFPVDEQLRADIQKFFNAISDMTIDESCSDEGLHVVIKEFRALLKKQECYNTLYNLDVLLQEKNKQGNGYRDDGTTPNIMHEIRNCGRQLTKILAGAIPYEEYIKEGGLDTDLTARIRHDSVEDTLATPFSIYSDNEKHLHALNAAGKISDEMLFQKRIQASKASELIELLSKQSKIFKVISTENAYKGHPISFLLLKLRHAITRRPMNDFLEVSIVKKNRGSNIQYNNGLLRKPNAVLIKYDDTGENVDTVHGIERFTLLKKKSYAHEKRTAYGTTRFDELAKEKWPNWAGVIGASDDMLGIELTILDGMNGYQQNEFEDPQHGHPFRFDRYLPNGLKLFENSPEIFHPISISIHSILKEKNNDRRIPYIVRNHILSPLMTASEQTGIKSIPSTDRILKELVSGQHAKRDSILACTI